MKYLYALALILAQDAAAPRWKYPLDCCAGYSGVCICSTIPQDRVRSVAGGYLYDSTAFITHKESRPSPDKSYRVCVAQRAVTCFFRPEMRT